MKNRATHASGGCEVRPRWVATARPPRPRRPRRRRRRSASGLRTRWPRPAAVGRGGQGGRGGRRGSGLLPWLWARRALGAIGSGTPFGLVRFCCGCWAGAARRVGSCRRPASSGPAAGRDFHLLLQLHQRDDAGPCSSLRRKTRSRKMSTATTFSGPRGVERLPLAGEALARRHVELVLVLEAAEQPAAAAGDLGRVEREVLVLGEREADGRELGEPGGAAVLPAAAADAAEPGRLVAHADLPELDPGPEHRLASSRTRARKSTRFSAVK